jgi:hypothetical protein
MGYYKILVRNGAELLENVILNNWTHPAPLHWAEDDEQALEGQLVLRKADPILSSLYFRFHMSNIYFCPHLTYLSEWSLQNLTNVSQNVQTFTLPFAPAFTLILFKDTACQLQWSYEIVTYLQTVTRINSMEQRPSWEANRRSASQEIPQIFRNPKVNRRIYKGLPTVPIETDQPSQSPIPIFKDQVKYYPSL